MSYWEKPPGLPGDLGILWSLELAQLDIFIYQAADHDDRNINATSSMSTNLELGSCVFTQNHILDSRASWILKRTMYAVIDKRAGNLAECAAD